MNIKTGVFDAYSKFKIGRRYAPAVEINCIKLIILMVTVDSK